MIKALIMTTVAICASLILQNLQATDINYNYVELGIASDAASTTDLDLIGVLGSVEITNKTFVRASYGFTNHPNAEFKSIGIGKAIPLSERTDLTLSADYINYQFDWPLDGESASAALLSIGSRTKYSNRIEFNPSLTFNTETSDVSASVNGIFNVAKYFALSGGLGLSDGNSSYSFGLRIYFPN